MLNKSNVLAAWNRQAPVLPTKAADESWKIKTKQESINQKITQ